MSTMLTVLLALALLEPSQNAPVFIATRPSAQVNLLRGPPEDGIQPREMFSSAAFRHLNEPMRQAAGHLNLRQEVASQGLKEERTHGKDRDPRWCSLEGSC
jgi:hypothetical protein